MSRFRILFVLTVMLLLSHSAHAGVPDSKGYLYIGGQAGYSIVNPAWGVPESVKNGSVVSGRLVASFYAGPVIFDFGGGYMYHRVHGSTTYGQYSTPDVTVVTQAGFFEFSPRVWLGDTWQFGPVGKLFAGQDVGFDENNLINNDVVAVFTGARLNIEVGDKYRARFGVEGLIDVTVTGRAVWMMSADIQFGFPFFGNGPSRKTDDHLGKIQPIIANPSGDVETDVIPPIADLPPAKRLVKDDLKIATVEKSASGDAIVKVTLGETYLRFATARADLMPEAHEVLRIISNFLVGSQSRWQKVRVEGHSDKRGSLAFNDRLSMARAQTVAQSLVRHGIPYQVVTAQGFGPRKPLDRRNNPDAYTVNRRVEIYLDNVSEAEKLVDEMNRL